MENINYKMGWLVVIFDLPVVSEQSKKEYVKFRHFLLDDGYLMIQFSVYARACVTFARQQTHLRRIKNHCPSEGSVRAFFLTNAQWENMMVFHGSPGVPILPEKLPEQLQFW